MAKSNRKVFEFFRLVVEVLAQVLKAKFCYALFPS